MTQLNIDMFIFCPSPPVKTHLHFWDSYILHYLFVVDNGGDESYFPAAAETPGK